MGEFQRWNTHHSHVVPIEVCGHQLNIAQDPSSDNLGTTIWDASVILVRYMERNPQLYSRRKLEGKRVLELGAGCGLAGMYFALQGAHVTLTDLAEVVPLLQRNVTMNLGGKVRGKAAVKSNGEQAALPQVDVVEYCWGTPLDRLKPPYDYVVACDCVYAERLVEVLVSSMAKVCGKKTTMLVASEKREEVTYAKFRERLGRDFVFRQAPRRHMDKAYDHENSEVLLCKLRRSGGDRSGGGDAKGEAVDDDRIPASPEAGSKGEADQGTKRRDVKARITNDGSSPLPSLCAKSQRIREAPQPPGNVKPKAVTGDPSASATAAAALHDLSLSTLSLGSSSASDHLVDCPKDADGHAGGR